MKNVNLIIAVGSVDGVATTAALYNHIGNVVETIFCQAFTVNTIDPSTWGPNRTVAFVDLAVNNRDAQMTADFVQKINDNGHKVVAIVDEHDAGAWEEVLGTEAINELVVKPQSQSEGVFGSSGAVLANAVSDLSAHAKLLCEAADNGDKMQFTGIAGLINSAVKSRIQDNTRRVELAKNFAFSTEPNEAINGWIEEYQTILANNAQVIEQKQELGNGFVRVNANGVKIDMTALMAELYKTYDVVVLEGMAYNKAEGKPTLQVSFATSDRATNLLAIVKDAGVDFLGGFPQKVNVSPENETAAFEAITAELS